MKKVVISVAAVLALAGCAAPAEEAPAPRPGSEAVYQRIESLSDCTALQQEFDTATLNHDRAQAGTEQATATTAYMEAADKRMQEVGCY